MTEKPRVVAQIRLTAEETDALNYLQYHYRVTSRSQVLRNLIGLGKDLTAHIERGEKILVETMEGEQIQLAFIGGISHGKTK